MDVETVNTIWGQLPIGHADEPERYNGWLIVQCEDYVWYWPAHRAGSYGTMARDVDEAKRKIDECEKRMAARWLN